MSKITENIEEDIVTSGISNDSKLREKNKKDSYNFKS